METLTVTSASATRNNFQSNSIVPLIKVKTTGFAAATAESTDSTVVPTPVMTVGHKLLCFTSKKPTELRVLDRIQAQKVDLTLTFNASFVATVVVDHIFAAAGETFVALVEAGSHPDGSITATQKQLITLDDTVRGIASGANGSLVVLGSNGTITQIDANGTTRKTQLPALKPGTAVKSSIVVTHKDAALAVVPGKGTGLDVISLNSDKSVLSKPWVPHGEDTPTFAHIFQTRTFDASSSSNTKYILTAANKNTELRFWALNSEDKSMNLLQQLTVALDESVAAEDAADGSPTTTAAAATVDDRQITISADEEYILLGSRVVPSIVVIELNRQVFKPSRFTDWNATGNVACFVPFTRKLQEGKNISIDLAAVVRTSDTILMATFDAARLVGASNIAATTAASASSGAVASSSSGVNVGASTAAASSGAASTAALGNRQNSVSKWFGQDSATPTIGGAPSSASSATAANAIPTSVSSSISGRFTSGAGDVQFVTVQAVNAIKGQAGRFREALSAIDEQIVTLQKQASHAIKTLQDAKAKDDAQLAGREFALRNKHRLAQGNAGTSNAAANALTPQQLELMHGLRNFVDSLAPSVREASSDTCRKLLANNLPNAIARAMQAADTADQDVSLPDLKVSHSMQQFGIAIDKLHQSQNNFLKTERNATEALSQRLTQGTDRINRTIASSKAYMSQLVQELSGLRHDVEDAKKVVRTGGRSNVAAAGGVGGAANQPSLEQIIEESLQLAQAGRWSDAVTKVERTGELSALMHFLLASEQYADVIVSVSNLSLTLVVQVCYRLALDLKSQVGNVPMRCKWLHDFLVEWDDTLQTTASDPKAFGLIREQLEVILDNLGQVDLRRDIDRKTKNEITLSKKILNSVL